MIGKGNDFFVVSGINRYGDREIIYHSDDYESKKSAEDALQQVKRFASLEYKSIELQTAADYLAENYGSDPEFEDFINSR